MSGVEAATLFAISQGVQTVGQLQSIQAQRAALARENYRIAAESRLAALRALEAENQRRQQAEEELANNAAFQSIAGYSDDSMSFLNINKQVSKNMNKDVADIRLMGKVVDTKYSSMMFENRMKERDLVFGGYTSVIAELTSGYATYKYMKGNKQPSINQTYTYNSRGRTNYPYGL